VALFAYFSLAFIVPKRIVIFVHVDSAIITTYIDTAPRMRRLMPTTRAYRVVKLVIVIYHDLPLLIRLLAFAILRRIFA
jgi:hypothetical protein